MQEDVEVEGERDPGEGVVRREEPTFLEASSPIVEESMEALPPSWRSEGSISV